jgi:hypothetical protein
VRQPAACTAAAASETWLLYEAFWSSSAACRLLMRGGEGGCLAGYSGPPRLQKLVASRWVPTLAHTGRQVGKIVCQSVVTGVASAVAERGAPGKRASAVADRSNLLVELWESLARKLGKLPGLGIDGVRVELPRNYKPRSRTASWAKGVRC